MDITGGGSMGTAAGSAKHPVKKNISSNDIHAFIFLRFSIGAPPVCKFEVLYITAKKVSRNVFDLLYTSRYYLLVKNYNCNQEVANV